MKDKATKPLMLKALLLSSYTGIVWCV